MTMRPWKTVIRTEVEYKSRTLPQTLEFQRSELDCGIIESMVTVNRIFEVLPFQTVDVSPCDPYVASASSEILEIASAAKRLGRGYMDKFAKRLSVINPTVVNQRLSFGLLDMLLNQIVAPDFFMGHSSIMRDIFALNRAGDATATAGITHRELPSGHTIPEYEGVSIFRNDYVDNGLLVLGRFDDETREHGVAGLVPEEGFIEVDRSGDGWLLSFTGDVGVFHDDAVAVLSRVQRW